MDLSVLLSKRFYNVDFEIGGGMDFIEEEIRKAYAAYTTALERLNKMQNNSEKAIQHQDIVATSKLFPYLDQEASVTESNNTNELVIVTKNMPLYLNWKDTLRSQNISNSENKNEVLDLFKKYPPLEFDQIFCVTPGIYSSKAVFTGRDVTIKDTTFETYAQFTPERDNLFLTLSTEDPYYKIIYKIIKNLQEYSPVTKFDFTREGCHPHITKRDLDRTGNSSSTYATHRICYGNHGFMGRYQEYLGATTFIQPFQILGGFLHDYLDWSNHVTIDDNYSNTFLVPSVSSGSSTTSVLTRQLMFQYLHDTSKMETLMSALKLLSSYLCESYGLYINLTTGNIPGGNLRSAQSTTIQLIKLLATLDLEVEKDGIKVYNSPIMSILLSLMSAINVTSQVLILPEIYAKLYLVLIRQYSQYIAGCSQASSGIINEGLESYIKVNTSNMVMPYSTKMFNSLLLSPKSMLARLLGYDIQMSEYVKDLKEHLRTLTAPDVAMLKQSIKKDNK